MEKQTALTPCQITIASFSALIGEACAHIQEPIFLPIISIVSTPNYYAEAKRFTLAYDNGLTPVLIAKREGCQWGVMVETWGRNTPIEIWVKVGEK